MNRRATGSAPNAQVAWPIVLPVALIIGSVAAWLLLTTRFAEATFLLAGGVLAAAVAKARVALVAAQFAATAAVLNLAGYLLNLWKDPAWFDEVVHFTTGLTVVLLAGSLIVDTGRFSIRRLLLLPLLVSAGLMLALAWEVVEWLIGRIDSTADTVIDVTLSTMGALVAALLCIAFARPAATADAQESRPAQRLRAGGIGG